MLKKSRQKKRFKAISRSMLSHLLAFFKTRNPESLHHFRIQVKKMKALLIFLQKGSKDNNHGHLLKSLQSIYKHAGEIRSAHINAGLLEQYSVADPAYKYEQEKIKKNEIGRFYARRISYIKTVKLIRKVFSPGFRNIDDRYIIKLYRKRLKKLARFFTQPNQGIEQLHKARKKIKNLQYLYRILPKSLADRLQLNEPYLDDLQDTIGKLHDVVLILELLKTEGFANGKVMTAINRKKRSLYHSIQVLSDDFANKVTHGNLAGL